MKNLVSAAALMTIAGVLVQLQETSAQSGLIDNLFKKPTQRHEAKNGPYYRMKADFTYKGDPVSFDIVIGCNALVTSDALNGKSFIAGAAPFAYGKEMKDGGALVAVTPAICTQGMQAVGDDFRPFMMTFPDAKAPWEGAGYATSDAYASPRSTLTFKGASLEPATEEEYKAWRATEADKNTIKPHMIARNLGNPFKRNEWFPGKRYFPTECSAALIKEIPPERRHLVKWPEGEPDLWEYGAGSARDAAYGDRRLAQTERMMSYSGNLYNTRVSAKFDIYPVWRPRNINNIEDMKDFYKEIDGKKLPITGIMSTKENDKGFANCQQNSGLGEAFSKLPIIKDKYGKTLIFQIYPEFINSNSDVYFQINNSGFITKGYGTIGSGTIAYRNEKSIEFIDVGFLRLNGGL